MRELHWNRRDWRVNMSITRREWTTASKVGDFQRVWTKILKEKLLYGPLRTGKTLLVCADALFLKAVASATVHKWIDESARVIRETLRCARDHQPCVILMDEIAAIRGQRFSETTSNVLHWNFYINSFHSMSWARLSWLWRRIDCARAPRQKNGDSACQSTKR